MQLSYKDNLKRILKEKNIQVKDLAEGLNIARESTSRLINQDYPSLQSVEKLAAFLNVEPSEILFGIKEDHTQPEHVCPHCGKPINITLG